jgi:NADH-quinone oxidoreductase subunit N
MSLFLGLEFVSLALYIMVSFNSTSSKSVEAGLKYFIIGSVGSVFFLYGISVVYGFFGTLNFFKLTTLFSLCLITEFGFFYDYFLFSVMLIVFSLFIKIGVAPLHVWMVDVYRGLNFFNFFFFSIFPKFCFFFVLVRLFFSVFFFNSSDFIFVFLIFGMLSIFIGTIGAFGSKNLKSIFVYTSISHTGFILLGLLLFTRVAIFVGLYYMIGYFFLMLALCLILMTCDLGNSTFVFEDLYDFSNYRALNLSTSVFLVSILFSMAGLPPFLGFFMKFYVFLVLFLSGSLVLIGSGIVLLFFNVLNAYVYIRLIFFVIFEERYTGFYIGGGFLGLINFMFFFFNVFFFIFFSFLDLDFFSRLESFF